MFWKITCYNGTVWVAPYQMLLSEAIPLFMKDCSMTELDIKNVENTH